MACACLPNRCSRGRFQPRLFNVRATFILCACLLNLCPRGLFLPRSFCNVQTPLCCNFEQRLRSSINVVRSAPFLSKMLLSIEASRDNYRITGVVWTLICNPYARLQVDDSISLGNRQRSSSYWLHQGGVLSYGSRAFHSVDHVVACVSNRTIFPV